MRTTQVVGMRSKQVEGDENYPGGGDEKCLDSRQVVEGQRSVEFTDQLVWAMREKQDSKMTLNIWHDNSVNEDTSY